MPYPTHLKVPRVPKPTHQPRGYLPWETEPETPSTSSAGPSSLPIPSTTKAIRPAYLKPPKPFREYRIEIPNRHLSLSTIHELLTISTVPSEWRRPLSNTVEIEENGGPETSEMNFSKKNKRWTVEQAIGSWQVMCGTFWLGILVFCGIIFVVWGLPLLDFLKEQSVFSLNL
jgi:hypothetical protein